ncbi:MAG: hypothetical protein GX444_11765 [Myxococcales bacterium]|nr:hypothetical protein [Myxococcales bacterium]
MTKWRWLRPAWFTCLVLAILIAFAFSTVACDKSATTKKEHKAEKKHKKSEKAEKSEKKSKFETPLDFSTLPDDFPAAMKKIHAALKWSDRKNAMTGEPPADVTDVRPYMQLMVNRDILSKTFELGDGFLVRNQKPAGNFNYMYDWLTKTWVADDNQVRQGGALWGVALCHKYKPAKESKAALDKGIKYWFDQTIPGPEGSLTVKYQNDANTETGTVALIALSIIEYLQVEKNIPAAYEKELRAKLTGYLHFLRWMQLDNGHFSESFNLESAKRKDKSSPYFDGEAMLCLCKAARYLDYKDLIPTIEKAARATAEDYTVKAWKSDPDSALTKGFYQWGSMSFVEYYESKWKDYELFGDTTQALAWWMVHTHDTMSRRRNHAYALEGLISAYRISKLRKDVPAMTDLLYVIDRSIYKLTSWQIGGPLENVNKFLVDNKTNDPVALGGIMNAAKAYPDKAPKKGDTRHELRIDVTQHQMHVVTLALTHVYPPDEKAKK